MMNRALWLYLFISSLLTYGCASDSTPITVNLKTPASIEEPVSVSTPRPCFVAIKSIEDTRLRKNDAGKMGAHPIFVSDVKNWLKTSIRDYLRPGFQIAEDSTDPGPGVTPVQLEITLKKLYHHLLPSTQSATVVLGIQSKKEGSGNQFNIYRGNSSSVNWTGSGDSIKDSFNEALVSTLHEISLDLERICTQR